MDKSETPKHRRGLLERFKEKVTGHHEHHDPDERQYQGEAPQDTDSSPGASTDNTSSFDSMTTSAFPREGRPPAHRTVSTARHSTGVHNDLGPFIADGMDFGVFDPEGADPLHVKRQYNGNARDRSASTGSMHDAAWDRTGHPIPRTGHASRSPSDGRSRAHATAHITDGYTGDVHPDSKGSY